jgi:hypothetical protein
MSDLSLKYDPQAEAPGSYPFVTDMTLTIQALANDQVPDSLRENVSIKHHRDAIIGSVMKDMSDHGIKAVLNTLSNKLRSMADNTSDEVRVYCEIVASIAYASGDTELAKKALLRIEPTRATSLLKTIYSAMIERGIDSSAFKGMLEIGAEEAINEWKRLQV